MRTTQLKTSANEIKSARPRSQSRSFAPPPQYIGVTGGDGVRKICVKNDKCNGTIIFRGTTLIDLTIGKSVSDQLIS